jgi:hypothetical protein
VVLRQLHGLLFRVGVHPASFVVAVVIVIIVFEYHKLGLQLLGLLLVRHFLRMVDRMRRSMGALAGGLPSSSHL